MIASLAAYDKSRLDKHGQRDTLNGLKYAVSAMQGWRFEMEDAHCIRSLSEEFREWSFFAVFDGHGGSFCSNKASEMLVKELSRELSRVYNENKTGFTKQRIVGAIKESFFSLDRKLLAMDNFRLNEDKSGTTVVAALITPTHIFFINCGDSRAILVRNDHVEVSTCDHKPTQLKEKQRIQDAGGIVALSRVNGGLATSRGIGDFEYKKIPHLGPDKQFVSSEPDVYIIERDYYNDKFIVLACDGIWDVIDNNGVHEFIKSRTRDTNLIDPDLLLKINEDLLDTCLEKGSRDNMSVIIVHFPIVKNKNDLHNFAVRGTNRATSKSPRK